MSDSFDTLGEKVQAVFAELVGQRALALRGDRNARAQNDILGAALAEDLDPLVADELAFHFVDWNGDAAFLVAFLLFPERFSPAELRAGVSMFLCHVPAHVLAAARLGGYEATDIFIDDQASAD